MFEKIEEMLDSVEGRLNDHYPFSLLAIVIWAMLVWPIYLFIAICSVIEDMISKRRMIAAKQLRAQKEKAIRDSLRPDKDVDEPSYK